MARGAASVVMVGLLAGSAVVSANWPAWRGPSANGVSDEVNLPVKWGPSENVAWKLALPQWSGATPIIWDDAIFLNVAESDRDTLSLWAVSRQSIAAAPASTRRSRSGPTSPGG